MHCLIRARSNLSTITLINVSKKVSLLLFFSIDFDDAVDFPDYVNVKKYIFPPDDESSLTDYI